MSDNKSDENNNTSSGKIPSIHTLESDLASAVMDDDYGKNIVKIVTDPKNNSTFNTNLDKEQDNVTKINVFNKKNILIFLIILFIVASVSTILYILYKAKNVEINQDPIVDLPNTSNLQKENELTPNQPLVKYNDILNPEILQQSDFSKLNRAEVVSEIAKIRRLLIDNKISPNNNIGINTNLDIRQLFEKIKYSGDESLLRSFGNMYALGLYSNEKTQFETYMLIEIDNFDLAFKSILDWEKYMPIDLKDIFIGNNQVINSSSTASSTEKKYYKNDTKIFVDRILKNYDIREYVDNANNMNIVYGFINNKFLLLTSGESSFLDIKNRLLKENISR